ncbi:hypothetical protein HYX05_03050 [Candidatus Woesearchaeota archaeon]|nr:hypothetical protein [Candidatus Woesearchaeota archaeon]
MAQEQVAKLKKKQWFQIIAPKQFENAVIGETLVYSPSQMLGKTLSHSLMNLTNDMKRHPDYHKGGCKGLCCCKDAEQHRNVSCQNNQKNGI